MKNVSQVGEKSLRLLRLPRLEKTDRKVESKVGEKPRRARAVDLARQIPVDPDQDAALAVRSALVNTLYCTFVGEFDQALRHRAWASSFETTVLLTVEETMDALAKAKQVQYRAPGA